MPIISSVDYNSELHDVCENIKLYRISDMQKKNSHHPSIYAIIVFVHSSIKHTQLDLDISLFHMQKRSTNEQEKKERKREEDSKCSRMHMHRRFFFSI